MKDKTFRIVTLGCKVNQYEGQGIREGLAGRGFKEADGVEGADVVVVNTCGVTQRSTAQSRRWISRTRRDFPDAFVVATGCCTDIDPEAVRQADLIVPQSQKYRAAECIAEAQGWTPLDGLPGDHEERKSNSEITISGLHGRTRAYLKVQDGCRKRCSYCAVRLARGELQSKPVETVFSEARRLSEGGCPEIVLCGVDLGAYGKDLDRGGGLVHLLEMIRDVPGRARFRLSSIGIRDVSDDLLRLIAESPRICPHLHVPLQSGNGRILKAMKRNYSPSMFMERIEKIREVIDMPAVTTDCMVGFPGETEDEFEDTVDLCREALFARVHVFRYSARPGTVAAAMPGRVREAVASTRAARLLEIGRELGGRFRGLLGGVEAEGDGEGAGRALDVVIEKNTGTHSVGLAGRYVCVRIEGELERGTRLSAVADGVEGDCVTARVLSETIEVPEVIRVT